MTAAELATVVLGAAALLVCSGSHAREAPSAADAFERNARLDAGGRTVRYTAALESVDIEDARGSTRMPPRRPRSSGAG